MLRAVTIAALFLAAGCDRPATADLSDSSPALVAPSSSAVPARASASGSAGPAFGMSSSGPGHTTMQVRFPRAEDRANAGSLTGLFGKISKCYRSSPHHPANEAVRISMHVTVSATGGVTTASAAVPGALVDKGHGAKGYEFAGDASAKDDALLKCADEAMKAEPFPDASRGTTFDITIDLSP